MASPTASLDSVKKANVSATVVIRNSAVHQKIDNEKHKLVEKLPVESGLRVRSQPAYCTAVYRE